VCGVFDAFAIKAVVLLQSNCVYNTWYVSKQDSRFLFNNVYKPALFQIQIPGLVGCSKNPNHLKFGVASLKLTFFLTKLIAWGYGKQHFHNFVRQQAFYPEINPF